MIAVARFRTSALGLRFVVSGLGKRKPKLVVRASHDLQAAVLGDSNSDIKCNSSSTP